MAIAGNSTKGKSRILQERQLKAKQLHTITGNANSGKKISGNSKQGNSRKFQERPLHSRKFQSISGKAIPDKATPKIPGNGTRIKNILGSNRQENFR